MFPQTEDPKGDPQKWSEEEMRQWLNNVRPNQRVKTMFQIWWLTNDSEKFAANRQRDKGGITG